MTTETNRINRTVEDWAKAEKGRLDEFVAWWLTNEPKDPTMFPHAMTLGEWDEQYRYWCGG